MENMVRENYIGIDVAADYLGVKQIWKYKRSETDRWVESEKSAMTSLLMKYM